MGYKEIKNIILRMLEKFKNEDKKRKIYITEINSNKSKKKKIKNNSKVNSIFNINNKKIKKREEPKNNPIKNLKNNINITNISNISNSNTKIRLKKRNKNKFGIQKKAINNIKSEEISLDNLNSIYIDKEINSFNYEKARKFDNRTYIQYYTSLIKTKHLLIFSFFTKNDYNSRINKICHFFFSFALLYTVNSSFFQDSKIHKIYEDKGSFDFIYQIPQIIYSTIISSIIIFITKFLSLSDGKIISLKESKNIHNFSKAITFLLIRFILFYIIDFLLLLLFWYYLGCFCAVYKNTQLFIIKDTLLSFLLSLIYPFLLNLIPGIFRIPALKYHKEFLYKISKIVQII